MTEITDDQIEQASSSYARLFVPNRSKYEAPYYTNREKYDDIETSYSEGARWMQKQQSQWISVKDRLPTVGQFVLVFRIEGYYSVDQYRQLHGTVKSFTYNVTHWMPLPDAPTA